MPETPASNLNIMLDPSGQIKWVNQNTAILIVHGIGSQLPLETLDLFGRGLIKQYKKAFGNELTISHEIVTKPDDSGGVWFDNVLRIRKSGSESYIDLYEYYWANYSQDVASWKDLNTWLQGMVKGAAKFYKKNKLIGEQYKEKSPFFDSKTGKFKAFNYWFFLVFTSQIFLIVSWLWKLVIWLLSLIPLFGKLADTLAQSFADSEMHDLLNVISEISVYNVFDPKSKFYSSRRKILDGAVKAVTFLIERPSNNTSDTDKQLELYYPSVIVAGHSLGSEIAYDAINKINLSINMGEIKNYDTKGICKFKNNNPISNQLKGYITFGCPLDKTVFFLRENVPNKNYLWQQFLDDYHEFKQRDIDFDNNPDTNKEYVKASCGLKPLLDGIQWRNYYDHRDYLSGGLDFYTNLTNIDCRFKAHTFSFTHNYYWDCDNMYMDIICNFLY
ncbi:MAG TPA: hypothetical protein VGN20_01600 [Mucilaginibacter sp.]|jgi:hypothetical protein